MKREIIDHLDNYIRLLEREASVVSELNRIRTEMENIRGSISEMSIPARDELYQCNHYMTEHGDLIEVVMDEEYLTVKSISVVDYKVLESDARST